MNSREKIKSSKAKSKTRRKLDDEFSKVIARDEAAIDKIDIAKLIADNARLDQHFEEMNRAAKEAVRIHESHVREATVARELLVKVLGKLGSDQLGERAAAAIIAERLRVKLGKTWNQLIVCEDDDDCFDYDDDDE